MIQVKNLSFSYSDYKFIEDMNFEIKSGEIFGFLGPSGAGKSTLQKILTGVISDYSGIVKVNNTDMKNKKADFYEKIGVDFEFPTLYEKLTARENLKFFSSLYKCRTRDIDELLKSVNLLNDADKKAGDFSKGMKSRLNFIKSLLHDPEILFLDEPTSGLDPTNSRMMKDLILEEKKKGKTVIVTTHNMSDATEICDRVAFIVDGAIKALDTPHNLIMQKGAAKVTYTWIENEHEKTDTCNLKECGSHKKLMSLMSEGKITSIHSSEPTLNDIFMDVTGRTLI
ncbi:MAG: ABC transporter ATP-binding protein [Inconstantimicrobium porci]|uniref:ABC transporter ATP-binding protein n=1 Tax=Inconstantimicrobium porci TaxID=2652291 RepID=A0A7X2MZQ7_9CLOT|nr:ABC transporter ATP-binding protein [Inconstantimicrobium porci]MDD6771478.1 ABC transporter ATP-binding protein [Inconstantimicrobium porci]MDY5911697.1 ABC transporter ATP-binding protein [Inconstantimicrobium porci]MSR92081.1 ABC transporter ATP-binding protein [Inconstantimicrobium porci]